MGEIIQASELGIGDLYRDYRSHSRFGPGGPQVRQVTGKRTVRTVETYEVLETLDIQGRGLRGEISLRTDVPVEKLEPLSLREVTDWLPHMEMGESETITMFEGRFWV